MQSSYPQTRKGRDGDEQWVTTSNTAVPTDLQRRGKMELKFNFCFCMALENGIPCLPWHL